MSISTLFRAPRLAPLLLVAASLALASCGGGQSEPTTAASQGSAGAKRSGATADCDPASESCPEGIPEACQSYVAEACSAVGSQSSACDTLKSAAPLLPPEACQAGLQNVDYTRRTAVSRAAPCLLLVEKLCSSLGQDSESCELVRDQTPSFPPERCELMLQHLDEVLADLQKRDDASRPLTQEKWASVTGGNPPSVGPKDAKVVVVEFSDFECPFCARAAAVTERLRDRFGDKVRFVFRQFPLPMHEHAALAAQASLAAHAQGKFWEFHDALFENQDELARDDLIALAGKLGLDVDTFTKALDEGTYQPAVESDFTLGESLPVLGTPTVFINGVPVANATDYDDVESVIEKELAE